VRKMTVMGASALLLAGLMASPAAAIAAPIAGAPVATTEDVTKVCPEEGKVELDGDDASVDVTAPEGMLISGYCVKAGSGVQEQGPEDVVVDPPAAEVTITHSSGKGISHYTLVTVEGPTPSPSPSVPGEEPSVEPSASTEPSVEPSGDVEPTDGASAGPVDATEGEVEGDSEDGPPVLASTGASTAIGFTLIALALVGGGATLIVLRRKGVLGS
jgi:LPXTG-motif cell wall-anchored protein